ncbi:MAG: hypothetical protein US75_C0003G0023 [Candidatus Woesebacteria bacterium GW2011_GWC1_38_13]|uniref:Uncharacterized protein n=1 Tax=Candidatus Woesebacteria bacterium GW2011_GWC1_38_13 TaxID=1618583 RepID=A0A0G0LW03_9BACT|nr:MAG: hypothetical protein US75_C0003G0023 [Candidatus Woesebacteria bacterium GW2011_GWC1_38_13]
MVHILAQSQGLKKNYSYWKICELTLNLNCYEVLYTSKSGVSLREQQQKVVIVLRTHELK